MYIIFIIENALDGTNFPPRLLIIVDANLHKNAEINKEIYENHAVN